MKKLYPLILILVFFVSAYSQERIKPERIEFLIDNPNKLTRADGWRVNNEGDWTKNQNIISGEHEDIWNSLPTRFNFKEFYFNKFEYGNCIYYCLIVDKFQTRYKYPAIAADPFLTDEIQYYIFREEHYLSLLDFINNKEKGIKFIKPIAVGECNSYFSDLTDKYIRFEMTKKLQFYYDLLKIIEKSTSNIWESSRKIRRLYKTYDNYLKNRIEEHDTSSNNNPAFAINYQVFNDKEIIRFLLPFDSTFIDDLEDAKDDFANRYFEVPQNKFVKILIN
jgi:hypothetical protein